VSAPPAGAPRPPRYLGPLVAALSVAAVLLVLELALRVLGIADPLTRRDPFEGFAGTPSAFVLESERDGTRRLIVRPAKRELLGDLAFDLPKPAETFRIFCFGGSVMRGSPVGPPGSFCRTLGDALQAAHPALRIETLNLGVSGFGSLRVLELVREAAAYEPDLFVLYLGQNELRDAHFFPDALRRGRLETALRRALFASRAIAWLDARGGALIARLRGARVTSYGAEQIVRVLEEGRFRAAPIWRVPEVVPGLAPEPPGADVATAPPGALRPLARRLAGRPAYDDEIYPAFDRSLETMLELAREAGAPVLLPVQAWNARETTRFTTRPVLEGTLVGADAAERFRAHFADGVEAAQADRCAEALGAFDAAASLYAPGHAAEDLLLGSYRGECQLRLGRRDDARATFAARVPHAHRRLAARVREAVAEGGLASVDVEAVLAADSADGIPGYDDAFFDNVHLTPRANRAVGLALARAVEAREWLQPGPQQVPPPPEPTRAPNADVVIAHGWRAFQRGRDSEAEASAREALALDATEVQALLLLGYALESQGRTDEAQATLARLRELWAQLGARS